MRYKLSPTVVYRQYPRFLYINDLKKHKIVFMNADASDVIHYLGEWRSEEELCQYISYCYMETQEEAQVCLSDILDSLMAAGIVYSDEGVVQKRMAITDIPEYEDEPFLIYLMDNHILFSTTIELTYSCNLKCRHCYISKQDRRELSTKEIINLIDRLKQLNVMNLVFTGGELFCRNDSMDIIQYACETGFMVDIFSNATLLDESMINRLINYNIHSFQSSIYSCIAEKHDTFVGQIGAFEKSLHVLKKFHEAGILIGMKTCLMNFNADEYDDLKLLASSIDAEFQLTYNIMPKKNGDMSPAKERIVEQGIIKQLVSKLYRDGRIEKRESTDNEYLCSAGYSSLSIDPYGDIYMCNALGIKVGNVLKDDIGEIWDHSKEIKQWLSYGKKNMKECNSCKYKSGCEFCPGTALKESGSIFSCYSEAKIWAKEICEIVSNSNFPHQ